MSKISIIVPVYNTKFEYLDKCLNSIVNQSYKDIEVIVVDDGSSVSYDEIIKKYEKDVRFFHQENKGVSSARNLGVENSTGDYIMFVDSDDWLVNDACLKFSLVFSEIPDVDIIISRTYVHDNDKVFVNPYFYNDSFIVEDKKEILDSIFLTENVKFTCVDTPWAKLYRRQFLVDNKIKFNERLTNGEDGLFNYDALFNASRIVFLNNPTYEYRVNIYSVCNTYCSDMDIKFTRLIEEYEKMFIKNGIDSSNTNFELFVLRIICRLMRKFYNRCENIDRFEEKFDLIRNNGVYKKYIDKIDSKNITFEQKEFVNMLKEGSLNDLYSFSKEKIKVKI